MFSFKNKSGTKGASSPKGVAATKATAQVSTGTMLSKPSGTPGLPKSELRPSPASVAHADFFNNPHFSDIRVVCQDGTSFNCHRMVMAGCSKALATLIAAGNTDNQTVIHINKADSATVKLFLEWIYGRHIQAAPEQLIPLWALAQQYDVQMLAEQCAAQIHAHCTQRKLPSECFKTQCTMLNQSYQLVPESERFRQAVFSWAAGDFSRWTTSDLLQLPSSHLLPLLEAYSSIQPKSTQPGKDSADHYGLLCRLLAWVQGQPEEQRPAACTAILERFPLWLLNGQHLCELRRHEVACRCPRKNSLLVDAYEAQRGCVKVAGGK